jgi:hypothetical protein
VVRLFVLLAIIGNGRAFHIRTTCVLALLGWWASGSTPPPATTMAPSHAQAHPRHFCHADRRDGLLRSGPACEATRGQAHRRWPLIPALSTLPPAVPAWQRPAKAMTQGAVPLFTQLWMVPRCTSTSPALRCTLYRVELHVDLARHHHP